MLRMDLPDPDQNQPLIFLGCRWGAWNESLTWACPHLELLLLTSQPWKLHRRPLVQTPSELYLVMMSSTILFSYWSILCHWSQPIRGYVVTQHSNHFWLKVSCTDIYLRSFNRDEIHAHAPTDISRVQPANLKISEWTFGLLRWEDQRGLTFSAPWWDLPE